MIGRAQRRVVMISEGHAAIRSGNRQWLTVEHMLTYPISRAQAGAPLTAEQHDGNLRSGGGFSTIAEMLADETAWEAGTILAADGHRYRVAASDAADHHLTTAGGVKFYVLPGQDGFYPLKAFGAVADDSTDIYDALWTAVYNTPGDVAKIDLGVGQYYCSETVQIKKKVHLRGEFGMPPNASAATRIRFPTETSGLVANHNGTYEGEAVYTSQYDESLASASVRVGAWWYQYQDDTLFQVVDPSTGAEGYDRITAGGAKIVEVSRSLIAEPNPYGTAAGSRFEHFEMSGTIRNVNLTTDQRTSPQTGAHGLRAHTRVHMESVTVRLFAGCGVMIYADVSQKMAAPWIYGEASMSQIDKCAAISNGGNGWHFQGYDVNACIFRNLDAIYNSRWGVWDRSFLGNVHIGHHISSNGSGTSTWGNPDNTGSRVFMDNGDGTKTYYEANDNATDQQLVDTQPGTDSAVWVEAVVQTGDVILAKQPEWQPDGTAGVTYFHGGAFKVFGPSASHVLMYVYTEGGQAASVMSGPGLCLGGIQGANFKCGGAFRAIDGNKVKAHSFTTTSISADSEVGGEKEFGLTAVLGGDSGTVFKATGLPSDPFGAYRFRSKDGVDFRWDHNNADHNVPFEITGNATMRQLGTGVPQPQHLVLQRVAIGPNGNSARRQTNGTVAPTTGTWARGDIMWNRNPSANGTAGWMCVSGGTPGTWATIELGAIAE